MSCLAVFPAPNLQDSFTLTEFNSNFVTGDNLKGTSPCLFSFGQDGRFDELLPNKDPLKIPTNLARGVSEPPFIPVEDSILQKLYNMWLADGFYAVLHDLSETGSREEVPGFVSSLSKQVLTILKLANKIQEKLLFQKQLRESSHADAFRGPIQAFSWHPHLTKFSVGFKDDSIRIFSVKRGLTKLLNHRYQKAISCCAWRPLSSSVLAVGCRSGIIIWTINQQSSAIRQGASSVQRLTYAGHSLITSISWSPGGRLLASGSASNGIMMIWDVTMESGTALHRIGGCISRVVWSPCDTKIFVATESSLIRVWETQKWTCEKWTNLASRCQAACWSPDGRIVVFSVAEEKSLYYLKFSEPVGATGVEDYDIGGAKMAVKCADLSEHSWMINDKSVSIGGCVSKMAWDPTGERLAVILKDEKGNLQDYIPVFKTNLDGIFELVPGGFIHGSPSDGQPEQIYFQKNFRRGSLLTIVWSTGKISFIPMLFSAKNIIRNNSESHNVVTNGHGYNGLYSS